METPLGDAMAIVASLIDHGRVNHAHNLLGLVERALSRGADPDKVPVPAGQHNFIRSLDPALYARIHQIEE